jgi:hypothetical protein
LVAAVGFDFVLAGRLGCFVLVDRLGCFLVAESCAAATAALEENDSRGRLGARSAEATVEAAHTVLRR